MARVVIEHLTKVFAEPRGQQVRALADLSLTVNDKEFLVLAGPSGCGKTTTLRLIAGLEAPSAGTISIDDQLVNDVPPGERDIAMVFQNHALYPHMTAEENMAFGLVVRKHSEREIAQRIQEIAWMLRVEECLDRRPSALSGGQRQRVALGRALVLQPKLLLFDEPLSSLDAPLRAQMRVEISRLHKRLGCTIIYVTHDQSEAMALGQRLAVLNQGALQQVADPLTVYLRPANLFVAGFTGSPPMNFFSGTLNLSGVGLIFQEAPSAELKSTKGFQVRVPNDKVESMKTLAGKAVVLGIRPEHIVETPAAETAHENGLEATLELVENLGPESYLHFATGSHRCIARARPAGPRSTPQQTRLGFEMRFAHFFDPANGQNVL
jgi:multiple sugar transport system ATP-binding protein